ncbi:MAG: TusE/DsrC/DsvC family sulfur relay protein [Roseiarcus sp.]
MVDLPFDSSMLLRDAAPEPGFRYAPIGWTPEEAERIAKADGLTLSDEHWEAIFALQSYYAHHDEGHINLRDLHDALEEKFFHRGGLKHLYEILPGGPIAQGCKLAGLKAPGAAIDSGMGSAA